MLTRLATAAILSVFGMMLAPQIAAAGPCDPSALRALVLSGGGVKGAFEAGAVYHLIVHRSCDFHDISGVSAGALNAAFLAQAPTQGNSLEALQAQALRLVALWRGVTSADHIMRPRFWGLLGVAVGTESTHDFEPLRKLIRREIDVQALRRSGRVLRIGVTSFWDGTYREILASDPRLEASQYLDYVYASALIPVLGVMPRIRESPSQLGGEDTWGQFGDGGVRHNTPIAGFFPSPGIKLLDRRGSPDIPPHLTGVSELFVVLASPYDPQSDAVLPPTCCPDPDKDRHVRHGRPIVERTLHLVTDGSYRWDLNYARIANRVLEWRDRLYEEVRPKFSAIDFERFVQAMEQDFPLESFNVSATGGWSRPYTMPVIAPERPLGGTFDISADGIASQLREGCLRADKAMSETFKAPTEALRCDRDFPDPRR